MIELDAHDEALLSAMAASIQEALRGAHKPAAVAERIAVLDVRQTTAGFDPVVVADELPNPPLQSAELIKRFASEIVPAFRPAS